MSGRERLAGMYLPLADGAFTACDAVALGLLAARQDASQAYLREYYLGAYHAVGRALGLEHPAEMLEALAGDRSRHPAVRGGLEGMTFRHLLRVREHSLAYCNVHSGFLEGDPWMQDPFATKIYGRAPFHAPVGRARDVWIAASEQIERGLRVLDEAICALGGWDPEREVSFDALRREHGFPDPAPVWAEYCDSL